MRFLHRENDDVRPFSRGMTKTFCCLRKLNRISLSPLSTFLSSLFLFSSFAGAGVIFSHLPFSIVRLSSHISDPACRTQEWGMERCVVRLCPYVHTCAYHACNRETCKITCEFTFKFTSKITPTFSSRLQLGYILY